MYTEKDNRKAESTVDQKVQDVDEYDYGYILVENGEVVWPPSNDIY